MRTLVRKLWRWTAAIASVLIILLALLVGAFRLAVTQVAEYEQQIEAWVSAAAGVPIEVDSLDARWAIDGPELLFDKARLLSPDRSRVLFAAREGSLGISLAQLLLRGELRVSKLVLRGAHIELQRDPDGRVHLADAPTPGGEFSAEQIPSGRFELEDATIGFSDLGAAVPRHWQFAADVGLRKERGHVEVGGVIGLPGELGADVRFTLELDGSLDDRTSWQAGMQAQVARLGFDAWDELLRTDWPLPAGSAADLSVSASIEAGRLVQATLDGAVLALGPPGGDADWERIAGHAELARRPSGWRIDVRLDTLVRAGRAWPRSELRGEFDLDGSRLQAVALNADFIRVEDLLPAVAWGDDGSEWRQRARDLAPRGDLRSVAVTLRLPQDSPAQYSVEAEFRDVGFEPGEKHPGMEGLRGHLRASESSGRVRIDTRAARYFQPYLFREAFDIDRAAGTVVWRAGPDGWRIISDHFEVDNADVRSQASVELSVPADGSTPFLDIQARCQDVRVAAKSRYLPVGKMPEPVVEWLDRAIIGGNVAAGTFSYRGATRGFLNGAPGELLARFRIENGLLDYMPGWPAVEGLSADVEFHNASLDVSDASGVLNGVPIERARASFADLRTGELQINGRAVGRLAAMHGYLAAAPLELGGRFADLRVDGAGELELDLLLPILAIDQRRIDARLHVVAGELGFATLPQRITGLAGEVRIDDAGIRAEQLVGELLSAPLRIELEPLSPHLDGGLLARASARIDVDHVLAELADQASSRWLTGETDLVAELRLPPAATGEDPQLAVRSALDGVGIGLPAPLGKTAPEVRQFVARIAFPAEGTLDIDASLSPDVSAWLEVEYDTGSARLAHGLIEFGEPGVGRASPGADRPDGLLVRGTLGELDADGWLALQAETEDVQRLAANIAAIELQAGTLQIAGYRLEDQQLALRRGAGEWWIGLNGARAQGSLLVPAQPGRGRAIVVDLHHLLLPERETAAEQPSGADPRSLPGIDLRIGDLQIGSHRFGSVQALVEARPDGLELSALAIDGGTYSGSGSGEWQVSGGAQHSALELQLAASDLSAALQALGFGEYLEGETGSVSVDVAWQGPPDGKILESVSGKVSVRLEDGQLLSVQPGAGRVFGLLSVGALPRRLALDFSDVFDKGLAFDRIDGDFVLDRGNAYTSNLLLKGPAAEIVIAGRTGLASRDYDQTAVVSGNVVGKALPVAGGLAGGPAVAAALLIFSEIFEGPLKGMSQAYYRIQGSWEDPDVERVAVSDFRKAPAPQAPPASGEAAEPAAPPAPPPADAEVADG